MAMTGDPIDLDGHRTVSGRQDSERRRRPANGAPAIDPQALSPAQDVQDQMHLEPARTWPEVMQKWRFLLERYAATSDAADETIQKLVRRALGDMERLRKREEREER